MKKMKKMLIAFLMPLFTLGMTISEPANADTLSDLREGCLGCHNVIVQPSGWSLDGSSSGKNAPERSLGDWLLTIDRMNGTGMSLPATTSREAAAQFLYNKQYLLPPAAAATAPLTSIVVTPINRTTEIGWRLYYSAQGTYGDGSVQYLRSGLPWNTMASMSVGRAGLGIGAASGVLYAVGGTSASGIAPTVEAYDTGAGTWSIKASLPTARTGLGVGVVNGILYAVGGSSAGGVVATVEAYDTATNTWSTKASLPTARTGLGIGVVNGILYAVGGSNAGGSVATVEAYDPVTNAWTAKAEMPTARNALGVGVVDGLIYAVGGSNISGDLSTVEAYNPATNTWTTQISLPSARSGLSVGVLYGILYAAGGVSNGATVATVESYDPATYVWTTQAPMPTARKMAASVAHDGLYFVGGQKADSSFAATVEAYMPNVTWSSSNTSVATISQSGEAAGVSYGATTITATSGNISGSTSLTVANTPPTVWAGTDRTVNKNLAITLWGDGRDTAPGYIASYQWTQIGGPTVALTGAKTDTLYFSTPAVTADTELIFQLTVTDNLGATASDTANVTVKSVALLPTANAGADQSVNAGATVTLTGYGTDPYGAYLVSYTWVQTAGPTVTLKPGFYFSDAPTFTAPQVTADTVLTFQLTVQNQWGETGSDTVNVTVKPFGVQPARPDLVVTEVSSSVATVKRGRTFLFYSTTKNQGTVATTAASMTGLYLSTDATITQDDTLLGSVDVGDYYPGYSLPTSRDATIPKTLKPGTYYLGAIADVSGVETESNESNNSFTGTTIQVK